MDKFVTRTKTWQTLTYTSTIQKSRKDMQPKNGIVKRKPLRESQIQQNLSEISPTSLPNNKRRLSIRDEHLLKIFTSKPDQPLLMPLNEDSGLSSSSQGSLESFNDVQYPVAGCNQAAVAAVRTDFNLCELSDYVNSADTSRSQQKLFISQTPPSSTFNEVLIGDTQTNPVAAASSNIPITSSNNHINANNNNNNPISQVKVSNCDETEPPTTPIATNQNIQMARIQRDINSPSATVRVRALRALKNPTKTAYTNFDVPHDEQDIISAEERQPPPPPSIEELMHDIVVYVEVRTGEDNRSEGVKKVISQLGARVNDKLLRGTTHVIFKDGLLSTYKKAKNWNIPVVSILWVEACKNKRMICDPKDFPISNIDRYENPELYEKMKRHKSMQPDSECNKRIRVKQGATKDSTPKTAAETLTKTPSAVDNTPKSSRKQTDISQFFRKLGNVNSTPIADNNGPGPGSTTSITKLNDVAESPATQLLNRIENNAFTPLQPKRTVSETNSTTRAFAMALKSSNSGDISQQTVVAAESKMSLPPPPSPPTPAKRTAKKKIIPLPSPSPKKRILQRRTSVQMPVAASLSTHSLQATEPHTIASGPMTRRRRSSIHTTMNMSLSTIVSNTPEIIPLSKTINTFSAIPEENNVKGGASSPPPQNINDNGSKAATPRRTSRSPKSPKNGVASGAGCGAVTKRRIIRRRTTYTNKTPEMSPANKKDKTNRRRTLYTPKPVVAENPYPSSELSITKINATSKVLDENLLQFALTPTTLIGSQDSIEEEMQIGKGREHIEPGALIEEHSPAMIFSSTRLPSANRRRTLFDVSMDIIQQRLHNINNSARRSVARELAYSENSPTILPPAPPIPPPPTTTKTNQIFSAVKRRCNERDESPKLTPTTPATTTAATTTTTATSPQKTIKKRKLFVPNDTSLILTATPPTLTASAKKNDATTSAKRRRTMTPRSLPTTAKARKSMAPNNAKSELIIKPPSPKLMDANLTKTAVQSVPMLAAAGGSSSIVARKEGGGEGSALTQLKITTSRGSSKIEITAPTITSKCTVISEMLENTMPTLPNGSEGEIATAAATSTTLPHLKGSFVSIISSKASDTTIKQQLMQQQQQQEDLMEVDENVGVNTPSETTIRISSHISTAAASLPSSIDAFLPTTGSATMSASSATSAMSTTTTTTTTNAAVMSVTAATTVANPKVVKKSQMSAIPDTIKDAVVVGAAGSCTQLQRDAEGGKKKWPYIVCTNMHREQIKVMREAIATLGGLQLSHFVNDETTHVISFEPRRTLNLLRALIRGLWILDYKWVLDSLKAGQWLNEEEYELREFSRAVEICRTERQAFGKSYKCELFSDLGTFYISSRCGPISRENLKELIELCGGKVVDHRKRAKYILGDPHKSLEDKVYVTPFWVLDSITHMQVMRQQKYAYLNTNPGAKSQQQQQQQQPQLPQPSATEAVTSKVEVQSRISTNREYQI